MHLSFSFSLRESMFSAPENTWKERFCWVVLGKAAPYLKGRCKRPGNSFPRSGEDSQRVWLSPLFPPNNANKLLSLFYPNNAKQNFPFLSVGVSAWQVILWRVRYLTYFLESKPYISYELSRIKTRVIGSHNLGEIPLVSVRTKATVMGKT